LYKSSNPKEEVVLDGVDVDGVSVMADEDDDDDDGTTTTAAVAD
jgi:hypothetical protein